MRSHHTFKSGCQLILFTALALMAVTVEGAQNRSASTANFVAQQQAEERYRRLYTIVEDLQSANVVLQQRVERLESQLQRAIKSLNDKQAEAVTSSQLEVLSKKLTQELKSLDDKRLADNKKILSELKKLANRPAPAPKVSTSKTRVPEQVPYDGPVYEITVEPGYTISKIAERYREQGHMIYPKDILKANPGLDPRRLQVGQVINIPAKQ